MWKSGAGETDRDKVHIGQEAPKKNKRKMDYNNARQEEGRDRWRTEENETHIGQSQLAAERPKWNRIPLV